MHPKSHQILTLLSQGQTPESMSVLGQPVTWDDIAQAASEALRIAKPKSAYHHRLKAIKKKHKRAYAMWTEAEELKLMNMFQAGTPDREIGEALGRQPSAIQSRLRKLGLVE
ncbi:MAG: hypothetical protein VX528_11275 [Candidatus Latescibacterota bacterium]|nr:hypothetical protein [Candidatus Latescibacterota bacterium]